jgi:succinyl-diaminopimelate desuccinylase
VNRAENEALRQVDALTDELVAFTQQLVRVPTVNPPGEAYARCAELIADRLRHFGYRVETLEPRGLSEHSERYPRPNVVGTLGPGDGPALHFNGHYDVVPPGNGWSVDPFAAEIRNGSIFGRGTCDQKAGIAGSIYAVEAIRRAGIDLPGTIEQSATPDEESGGFAGVAWLCDSGRIARDRQRYVIITEPLDPERVCIGHRGVYWFEVTALGRVGHGSMPGLAVNAAERMAHLIRALEDELAPRLAQRVTGAPVEPEGARRPSINLNAVHAGQPLEVWQTPTVPDRCTAVFDRRFLHEERFEDVRAEIIELLDGSAVQYELRDVMRVDPLLGDAEARLPGAAGGAIRDVLGQEPTFVSSPGTYDHKHVVRRGGLAVSDCIAYGPGRLVLAHQPDEHIAIDDLVKATKVMAVLTLRLLS